MRILLFTCFALLAAVVWQPTAASAATYSVSPLIIDLELEKRDIITKQVTITNQDRKQIRVYPSVHAVNLADSGAIESFVEPSMVQDRSSSVTSWIQVTRGRIVIPPGESKTVPITFKVHPDAQAGEYHAIVGFGDGSNSPQAEQKVRSGTAPAVVIRIAVDQVQNQFLRLERFAVERFVTDTSTSSLSYTLHNPGDDPVTPAGEIIFYDNRGNEVASTPVNPDGTVVEPGKKVAITNAGPTDLGMGKYKAFLSVEYGEHLTASVHDTSFFYVLPLTQLLLIFVVVLVFGLLLALYIHRRYGTVEDDGDDMTADVPMFVRSDRSAAKDHDIDLSKKE